jgi:hypothetical protein
MGVRRPEWVMAAAVAVCAPMVPGILNGSITTLTALVRFLGAIIVCWMLAAIVQAVLDRYEDAAFRREFEVRMARSRAQGPPTLTGEADDGGAGPAAHG